MNERRERILFRSAMAVLGVIVVGVTIIAANSPSVDPPVDPNERAEQSYVKVQVQKGVERVNGIEVHDSSPFDWGNFTFDSPSSGTVQVYLKGHDDVFVRFARVSEGEAGVSHDTYAVGCTMQGKFTSLETNNSLRESVVRDGHCP